MKPTKKLLREVAGLLKKFKEVTGKSYKISIIGGRAVVIHGLERTTKDIDLCFDCESGDTPGGVLLSQFLETKGLKVVYISGTKDPNDPLRHDIIIIDGLGQRIDILIAAYKWEQEGLSESEQIEGIGLPLMPKPYLIAMKLLADGYKDRMDIEGLWHLMTSDEKEKTMSLAKRIKRDKNLLRIISRESKPLPPPPQEEIL